ncbi:TIGR03984 family CRISPR-associated protein [Synechococcales cyanobacterium C]|uniref:TIGR03984 family CRISPR-associated protein n=1 Tax=Petrachloros mirabilis ULC683 TaxID=2781853 RepID=A0A8K2A8H0_9CYAN|nr:CRISPR-associated protein Csx19 [Petrachloros mirabilis]NCJ08016.1 TIGR03984 family CRISPR-associated protein [Petrachloros mirabilis ULC683]
MTQLYGRRSLSISLTEALRQTATQLKGGTALLYTPNQCQLAQVTEAGHLNDAVAGDIDLSAVFEARIFNPDYELRWLHQHRGQGVAVLLAEQPLPETCFDQDLETLEAFETISQQYLLWGKGTETTPSPGWGQLADARIGTLAVPVAGVTQERRVVLKTREYLKTVDPYGNVAVVEERLLKLGVRA